MWGCSSAGRAHDWQLKPVNSTTYADVHQRYLSLRLGAGGRPSSYCYLTSFWLQLFQGRNITEISTEEIEDCLNEVVHKRGWSASTRNNVLKQLSGLFSFALRRRWVIHHPIKGIISYLPEDNARTRWLSPKEIKDILKHCPPWLQLIVQFGVKTGMRLREITSLRVKDFQLDTFGNAYLTTGKTKNGQRLTWPVEGQLLELVMMAIDAAGPNPDAIIFPGPNGGNAVASIRRYFRAAVLASGMSWGQHREGVTFHTLRHSMASLAIQNGISESVIQKLGNWKTRHMVARYAHLADKQMREAASVLDSLL